MHLILYIEYTLAGHATSRPGEQGHDSLQDDIRSYQKVLLVAELYGPLHRGFTEGMDSVPTSAQIEYDVVDNDGGGKQKIYCYDNITKSNEKRVLEPGMNLNQPIFQ